MPSRMVALLVLLLTGCALFAQSAASAPYVSNQALLDRLQQMEKRILELEDRQRKLEAALVGSGHPEVGAATATNLAASAPAQQTKPSMPSHMDEHTTMREESMHYPSLQI